ncbi:MAG: dipeptidase [Chromatiales bacterium]|nr:dipeptidase [Chromatiales bacterium]
MTRRLSFVAVPLMFFFMAACSETQQDAPRVVVTEPMLIVDTHIDVPYRLEEHYEDVSNATEKGDFDYPRAVAGGLNVAFMSVYVPAEMQDPGAAKPVAEKLIRLVRGIESSAPEKFSLANSTAQVMDSVARGKIAMVMGMENGAGLEDDLANVAYFHAQGIRYVTLTHGKANLIADSSYDMERPWGGLSPYGREVVKEMNRVGIMVDVSHVSDETFYQVMDLAAVPVIASHSSARYFTPGFERNMSDDMIRRLARDGGVIQINFGSSFLTGVANQWFVDMLKERTAWTQARQDGQPDSEELEAFVNEYRETNPMPYASLDDVLDHIDHAVGLGSVDNVGIGSDFDGVGDSLPVGLKDVSDYPNLIAGLRTRGYSDEDIRKIMGGNLMRVWRMAEDYADGIRAIPN